MWSSLFILIFLLSFIQNIQLSISQYNKNYNKYSLEEKEINVGAIFYEDESELDTYFQNAIEFVNEKFLDETKIKLNPIIKYMPTFKRASLEEVACNLMSEGAVAIFGPSSKTPNDIVASICHHFQIPHILFDLQKEIPTEVKMQHSMSINIYPDMMVLSKAFADIVHAYSWKTFSIIYETNEGLVKLQEVLHLLPIRMDEIKLYQAKDGTEFDMVLKNIKNTTEKRIIVDCAPENLQKFINSSLKFNMTDIIYSYLFTNLDTITVDLKKYPDIKSNTTAIRLKLGEEDYETNVKNEKASVRVIHDAVVLFAHSFDTFLKHSPYAHDVEQILPYVDCTRSTRWEYGKRFIETMKDVAIKQKKDIEFITGSMNFNNYNERIMFELEIYDPRNENAWLKWDPQKSVEKHDKRNHTQNVLSQSSLKGNTIIVATRLGEPYLRLKNPNDVSLEGNLRYEGYSLDLISVLAQRIGFDFIMSPVADKKHGNYDAETKEWNGIIRELKDGRAHLGICDLTITHERKTAVEFTVPFMSLGLAICYYNVQPAPPDLFSFLNPYALEVWLYMGTALLIISILNFFLARISKDEWTNPHPCNRNPEELENIWNMSNSTWLSIGSIMTQGSDILPRSGSLRFVTGMWWFFALMIVNTYTANLAAFLTQSQMTETIGGISDLPEQSKVKYGIMGKGSTFNFFRESNDSLYKKLWNAMNNEKPTVFVEDNDKGVERVLKEKGKYAFLMETTSLEYQISKHCELQQIGKKFSDRHYGIAMPMGVSYRSELNVEILKLQEEGYLRRLKERWWNRTGPPCEKKYQASEGMDLSIAEVGGVFLVLGAGLFASFVIGIAEFLWNVQQVAVEEKITPFEAFKNESMFVLKFWINRKPIKKSSSGNSSATRSLQEKYESGKSSSSEKDQDQNNRNEINEVTV